MNTALSFRRKINGNGVVLPSSCRPHRATVLPTSPSTRDDLAFNKRMHHLFSLAPTFRSLVAICCSLGRRSRVHSHSVQRFFQARFCALASPPPRFCGLTCTANPCTHHQSVAPRIFQRFVDSPYQWHLCVPVWHLCVRVSRGFPYLSTQWHLCVPVSADFPNPRQ